jgi:membrane protein YdbS with pleckstrin-like domain
MKISIYSEHGDKRSLKNLLITAIILVVVAAVLINSSLRKSVEYNWQSSVIFLFIFIVLFVTIYFAANKFNKHQGHEYEKEFDDEKL